jgi:hypothetical protein
MDLWSEDRAKSLALANQRITSRMMTSAFASWRGFGWSFRNSGLWFYNPLSTCYTFLPYGYGWGSPYGNNLFNFDLLPSENLHASESRRLGCTDHDHHQLWRDYPDRVEPYANDADLSSSDDRKYAVNDTTGRESAAGGR